MFKEIKMKIISAYQYVICCLVKSMPHTDDEIFNYRIDISNGKLSNTKPNLAEALRIVRLLGLTVGFDRNDKYWWSEDENGEYIRGNSFEEVALLIAVVYNNDKINNFRAEYETDAKSLDTKT